MSDYTKARKCVNIEDMKPVRAPFAYYGAKQRLARKIISILPKHNAWVEAFCGSAALTFAKPPSQIEIINDWDGQIVNLFKQLRDHSEELSRVIALTPYALEELEISRKNEKKLSNIERARRFLVGTMMTVNGTPVTKRGRSGFSYSNSFTREGREARVNRWCNMPDRLKSVVGRLKNVRIEKRDARKLVQQFSDRPATLMYLDPPYFTKREHGYVIDANNHDFHEELLEICIKARCMLLLSGYDNDLYQQMLVKKNGWKKRKIETHTRDTTGKDYARTEVLWMNKQFMLARKLGRPPLRLSRKELEENKVNPIRKR